MIKDLYYFIAVSALLVTACTPPREPHHGLMVQGVARPLISLNGTWKFTMDPPEKYWERGVDFQSWPDIQVPGECQMQGFAIKHDQPYVYKKLFSIPRDYEGKHVRLDFHGVYSFARVWIDGHFIREHFGGFTKWSCDITEFVKAGDEVCLTVEIVDRIDEISYGSGYAKHQIGGILRDVELTCRPKQHFEKLYVETELDDDYRDAELKLTYKLSEGAPTHIKFELWDEESTLVESVSRPADGPDGQMNISVANPRKWDAEHPHLYTLVGTLSQGGHEILKTTKQIGFREVVVEGNKLLVNGLPVKLRGANRHDIHPILGRTTTPAQDLQDVLLAKECNINFIRTSHYPPSERFLDFCDQYGIYVEDETAVCFVGSHRTKAYQASGSTEDDPNFTGRYLSQLQEMVENHRNHPSIIIWSIGNENWFGNNFVESYNWVKENDQTRPVIYSYPGLVPDSLNIYDILSMHYPDWTGDIEQFGIDIKGFDHDAMPVLFDEWAHVACYNNFELQDDPNVRNFWSESLDRMWTKLFETEGGLGGAIWCMLDETFMLPKDLEGFNEWWGILDKDVIPATYEGPTVGYGEWGIIDTWRRKKPEFWGTKKAYSPTKITVRHLDQFEPNTALTIPIHNRFDHTNFNELIIAWQYGKNSGELTEVNIGPHQKGELTFPPNDWNSDQKLNIQFFQNDTFLVDEYNIQLGQNEMVLPRCRGGDLVVDQSEERAVISGENYRVEVNKKTGLLENLMVAGEVIVKSGPYVNLKFPGEQIQYSTIKMDDYAQNWNLTQFDFAEDGGIATIRSSGSYDKVSASFTIQVDAYGVMHIDYIIEEVPSDKNLQEAGILFLTEDSLENLSWTREGYFTAYPEGHLGASHGEVSLSHRPDMTYRQDPKHTWAQDSKGFYYFGLDQELPYINIVRSLKENIYSYSLKTSLGNGIEAMSAGRQAGRFDKIDGKNTLIINDHWDYNSLMWGNYMKNIRTERQLEGEVVLKVGAKEETSVAP